MVCDQGWVEGSHSIELVCRRRKRETEELVRKQNIERIDIEGNFLFVCLFVLEIDEKKGMTFITTLHTFQLQRPTSAIPAPNKQKYFKNLIIIFF